MSGKDYNVMSEYGVKDTDYCKEFGMPEDICGTPKVNDWLIEKVYTDNRTAELDANLKAGMETKEATKLAEQVASEGRQEAKRNVFMVKQARGY